MSYHNELSLNRARELRKSLTRAEKKIWLESLKYMPVRFRKQHPFGHYILDFYCPKLKLVIEVDGWIHGNDEVIIADKIRDEYLKANGLFILRFTNEEVETNLQGVSEIILATIVKLSPPSLETTYNRK
ncbi:MAG: endonuclease domain-containing protein [Candidatus Pacebacteria bacterium]|nr:endonuclease domain-containing protein [Candidatus Paceibacterota bacterium]